MTGDERRTSDGDEDGEEPPDSDPDPDSDPTSTPDPDDADPTPDPDAEDAATGGTGDEGGDGTPDDDGGDDGDDGDDPGDGRVPGADTDGVTLPSEERYGERREAEFPDDPDRTADPDAGDDADSGSSVTRVSETEPGAGDTGAEAGADIGVDSDADVEWADERDPDADPEIERDGAETDADADEDEDAVQSDGGAAVSSASTSTSTEADPSYEDGFVDTTDEPLKGPASDKEMPLADHIEEMVSRLGVVILAMSIVSVLALPFSVDMINFIWYSILGSVQDVPTEPRIYRPLALVLARLKVATLVGFVAALPVFVYETYLFMRPGLYQYERRYYLAAVPTSLVLAFIGVAFAFYLVLPALFTYFVSYTVEAAGIAFGLTDTFGLMLLMMGFFAAVFQIPLLIMLAVMMGLTTRRWLADRRLYFWGGFLGVALIFSPDPTGMAPIIVALTMVGLFEGTLLLLRWTDR